MSPELNEADCSEALHRVFEYLDGELEPSEHAQIAAHLDTMVKGLVKRSCEHERAPVHLRGLVIQRITAVEIRYLD